MSSARIYHVTGKECDAVMVKATSQAQAIRRVVRDLYSAEVATAIEVAEHMTAGGLILDATTEPQEAGQ